MTSPLPSRVGASSLRSAMNVPFLLPRSSRDRLVAGDRNQRVAAGNTRGVEKELEVGVAAQHVLAVAQASTLLPDQTEADVAPRVVAGVPRSYPGGSRNA